MAAVSAGGPWLYSENDAVLTPVVMMNGITAPLVPSWENTQKAAVGNGVLKFMVTTRPRLGGELPVVTCMVPILSVLPDKNVIVGLVPAPAPAVNVGVPPLVQFPPKLVPDPVDRKHCPLVPNDPPSWIPVVKLAVPKIGVPENVGLPANVPASVPPPDKVAAPLTPNVPPMVSFPTIVALLFTVADATVRLLDKVVAPVTPRVPDIVSFPDTVSPLMVVAFSVPGIMLAVSGQNVGVAGDPVQLPNTVFAFSLTKLIERLQLVVHGDPETEKMDDGMERATLDTVPVPFMNTI